MITGELKGKIDALWLSFFSNGITNPISVIEQISFLMFARLLDMRDVRAEKMAKRTGDHSYKKIFNEDQQHLRWSHFSQLEENEMFKVVRDDLFEFFSEDLKKISPLGKYFENAQCLINKASLASEAIEKINELPLEQSDIKGDLYEYMLGKMTTAGIAGQFRTPRHIIDAMVEMSDPLPTEKICDPAAGTAGFLVQTLDYLKRVHSSEDLIWEDENGEKQYPGDLLEPYKAHIATDLLTGFDFDQTMLRIGAMNLLLHGIESPSVQYQDTLGNSFVEDSPTKAEDYFDLILANPPFKGAIDADSVSPSLTRKVKTAKTELLFLALIHRMLKVGGRAAVVVPDGVLFGGSKAHLGIRKLLIEENQLEAVISLPSGVFRPYAGVSTAILIFSKGGRTDKVWFYGVKNDGFSLDDKRDKLPDSDLPDLIKSWKEKDPARESDYTAKSFFVPLDKIKENKFDLSYNRYHEEVYEEIVTEEPKVIIKKLRHLEIEISKDLDELEELL
ncbi:type I restriction-modification system subunit M [bacterium]|nr:type I restriction-modification system subunit M [bacterium]